MATRKAPKTRCGGRWSEGQYKSWIKSFMRRASMRWAPRNDAKKAARYHKKLPNAKGRLVYHSTCAHCKEIVPETTSQADHILPVILVTGWDSWDGIIERMFCEKEAFQILCTPCHKIVTQQEKEERKKHAG